MSIGGQSPFPATRWERKIRGSPSSFRRWKERGSPEGGARGGLPSSHPEEKTLLSGKSSGAVRSGPPPATLPEAVAAPSSRGSGSLSNSSTGSPPFLAATGGDIHDAVALVIETGLRFPKRSSQLLKERKPARKIIGCFLFCRTLACPTDPCCISG